MSSNAGYVYSLDAGTGCVHWAFRAQAAVRSSFTIGRLSRTNARLGVFFGDIRGTTYALDVPRTRPLAQRSNTGGNAREDIVRGVDILAARDEVDHDKIYGVGVEAGGVALLHAAAIDPRIRRVALERVLVSYQSIIDNKIHRNVFEDVIPGVLKTYDLPDLARMRLELRLSIRQHRWAATDPHCRCAGTVRKCEGPMARCWG